VTRPAEVAIPGVARDLSQPGGPGLVVGGQTGVQARSVDPGAAQRTGPPSHIDAGRLVLDARGAAMVAAALRIAAKAAGRDGVDVHGRTRWDDFSWLLKQADLVAGGTATGTAESSWTLELPASDATWSTAQAAGLLGISVRAVVKAISAGRLPATRHGRAWVLREADVREFDGRRGAGNRGRRPPGLLRERGRPAHVVDHRAADEPGPAHRGRPERRPALPGPV
jgi:excisionase family DNA binding protein